MPVFSKHGAFNNREFLVEGISYTVISTDYGESYKLGSAIDRIKRDDTNEIISNTRHNWIEYFKGKSVTYGKRESKPQNKGKNTGGTTGNSGNRQTSFI